MNPVDEPIIRPKAVDSAFQAVLAAIAISTVATVVTVLLDRALLTSWVTQMLETMPKDERPGTAATVDDMQVILGVSIAIFAALFVLFAVKMRAGRNWARVLLTIYTGFNLFSFLTAISSEGPALGLMWNLAEVAFGVTAVVYMFRPDSAKYFADHKQRRLQARQRP